VLEDETALVDYMKLDDASLMGSIAHWGEQSDPLLRGLCQQLIARRLPKTIPLPLTDRGSWDVATDTARSIVKALGRREDLEVRLDIPWDVPYGEPEGQSPKGLWVQISHRALQRVGDVSFLLGELRNKRLERPRLIIPAACRDEIERAVRPLLGGEEF